MTMPEIEPQDETMSETVNILVVDDIPANLTAMKALIGEADDPVVSSSKVVTASSGNEALRLSIKRDYAVILLDVQMPEMDGFETAELLRLNKRTKNIPIIFITAISKEDQHVFRGYETGAVDYLFKPLDPRILIGKLRVFCELQHQKQIIRRQLKQLEEARKALKVQATRDALTGSLNRGALMEALNRERIRAGRENKTITVGMLDLDHFKEINDVHGHLAGDVVLKQTVAIIKNAIRPYDVLGRYGGEEFLVVFSGTSQEDSQSIFERVRQKIEDACFLETDHSVRVTASIGVATAFAALSCDDLLHAADKALYRAKQNGRNCVELAMHSDYKK